MKANTNKLDNIPVALKEQNIFCGFYNDKEGKLDKKPISIVTKRGGFKSDNIDKLTSYTKAVETYNEGKIAAIGVGLSPPIGIVCIDLDCHKAELQDKYNEVKSLILSKFKSYAENSVSGSGIHIYVRAILSECYKNKDSLGVVEVFDNRCVVVTGDIIDGRNAEIYEEQEALNWLCDTYMQKNDIRKVSIIPPGRSIKTDQDIIDKIKSGHKVSCAKFS